MPTASYASKATASLAAQKPTQLAVGQTDKRSSTAHQQRLAAAIDEHTGRLAQRQLVQPATLTSSSAASAAQLLRYHPPTPVLQLAKNKKSANNKLTEQERRARNWDDSHKQAKKVARTQSRADTHNRGQLITVPQGSQEFQRVKQRIEQNVRDAPYATDAFHETQPLMKGIMNATGTLNKLIAAKSAFLNVGGGRVFTVRVTNVSRIINPKARKIAFEQAKFIGKRGQGKKTTEELYAGHSAATTAAVISGGYRPDLGAHDSQKGYGALGRGSYFSGQAAKAATYGGLEPSGGTLLVSQVITGNQKVVTDGSGERHKTHNSMVRGPGGVSIPVPPGYQASDSLEDESSYDSIKGRKTYAFGAGTYKAIYYRNQFDSDEILVRNHSQILPQYKVDYQVIFS